MWAYSIGSLEQLWYSLQRLIWWLWWLKNSISESRFRLIDRFWTVYELEHNWWRQGPKFSISYRSCLTYLWIFSLAKYKSNSEPKMIKTLSFCLSVDSQNVTSKELEFRVPEPNNSTKNFQIFTGASWFSYLQLPYWPLSQEILLSWSKNLNGQTTTFWQKYRGLQTDQIS